MSEMSPIEEVAAALIETYGSPEPEKGDKEPLDGLILTILSQNTSDRNRDAAFGRLKAAYPRLEGRSERRGPNRWRRRSVSEAWRTSRRKKSSSCSNNWTAKETALTLKGLCDLTNEEAERYLLSIDGVGQKDGQVRPSVRSRPDRPFPWIRTYSRIAKRLGWIPDKCSADRAHDLLGEIIPRELMYGLHINLIRLGRALCRPRNPDCDKCPLSDRCAFGRYISTAKAGDQKKETRHRQVQ